MDAVEQEIAAAVQAYADDSPRPDPAAAAAQARRSSAPGILAESAGRSGTRGAASRLLPVALRRRCEEEARTPWTTEVGR